jgi:hypothetical protein
MIFEQGGSLSCHNYCDTGPRFFRSHPKDRPIQSPLTTRMGMWGIYSNPDPDWYNEKENPIAKHAWKIDWLFAVLRLTQEYFTYIYGNNTITGERLQNIGLCSALRAFEQGGIFIVPHLMWHGTWFFQSHLKDLQSPLTTHKGVWMIYSNPDPHGWGPKE